MPDSSSTNPLDTLAAEFMARLRRGESPSIGEYANRHPDLADEIHDLFPACLLYTSPSPRDATLSRMPSSA